MWNSNAALLTLMEAGKEAATDLLTSWMNDPDSLTAKVKEMEFELDLVNSNATSIIHRYEYVYSNLG
jgi:hypothetical protein